MMGKIRNTEQQLDHILLHSFWEMHSAAAEPFTRHGNNLCNYAAPKQFS
jgi:hypothetical protein